MNITKPVLIVDDNPISVYLTTEIISDAKIDCEIIKFVDANEALHYLTVNGDDHIVLLDLNMPLMSGWDFVEACKLNGLSPEVHILSSSVNPVDVEKIQHYDFVKSFLSKPLDVKVLLEYDI